MSLFLIAEAGVNHNGSVSLGKKLIDAAANAGADAVKFQSFKADRLVRRDAPKARYQNRALGGKISHWQMIANLELSDRMHEDFSKHCKKRGIEFLSTPFDAESLGYLVSHFNLRRIKIPSGEIVNAELLLCAARTGLPVILSTGMSSLDDIKKALGVLVFGYMGSEAGKPCRSSFDRAFSSSKAREILSRRVTLLHCTSQYPAPLSDMHLRAMTALKAHFNIPVGLSDHSEGIAASCAAVALDAAMIEKHFTLDRSLPGPDHRASMNPEELQRWVKMIRETEKALGSTKKTPAKSEHANLRIIRKGLVALSAIQKGEMFTRQNLTSKRPAEGLSPIWYWDLLGKRAKKAYRVDEPIDRKEFKA